MLLRPGDPSRPPHFQKIACVSKGAPLQYALEDMVRQHFNAEVAQETFGHFHGLIAARRELFQELIRLFGCPLEYDNEYHVIAFLFPVSEGVQSPWVAVCECDSRFPQERPTVVLHSLRYSSQDTDLPQPVTGGVLEYDFQSHWSAREMAYAIRSHTLKHVERLERACRDRLDRGKH